MKVRRDIASLPARTAKETWSAIVSLVTGAGSVDSAQLEAAASVICSAIADEHCATAPIVLKGGGSRLVLYTVHGSDAMEAGLAVDKLSWNPTASDSWAMTVPCSAEDVEWMSKALKERASRITVHDVNENPVELELSQKVADVEIDWTAMEKS
ncbi:MAG: hypothetical protein Q8K32_07095 [Archangium sp.]|nr:hypothetical protein [Archangium sp.]